MRVAFVRGPTLSAWELRNYELPVDVTAFASLRAPLAEHGFSVAVRRLPSPYDAVQLLPQHAQWLLLKMTGSVDYLLGLEHALKGYDIAHVAELHNPFSLQAVAARDRGHCRKVVATVMENIPARPLENAAVERRSRRVAEGVDHFIAITERARTHLHLAGVPDDRITVLPMGIDMSGFRPADTQTGGPLRILSVGRLVWEKGMEDLVVAMRLLADRGVAAKLTIVGTGPLHDRLQRVARDLGVADDVELAGSVPYAEVPAFYRRSDVFVLASVPLPTWREQFGFAVIEALASGLPALVGDSGSLPEVVGSERSLVKPHDPVALADALAGLAADPELRRTLGEANRARAEERFDREKVGARILEIYERVLAG